jgi:putative Holliday junction resolvase
MPDTLLGFDYGLKNIGIAVGQTLTHTASPLTALVSRNEKPDWDGISRLISEWQPVTLIVGLPLNMDDTEMEITPRAKKFARQLHGRYHLPVYMIDEKLSTKEAERYTGPKAASGGRNDATAAAIILETWMNNDNTNQ